jgi:hypothetical protein
VGVLQITPKLIDAAFGKLPGALADAAAKLGINFLESRRRLVIYDLGASYDAALFGDIIRMAALGGHHLLDPSGSSDNPEADNAEQIGDPPANI